MKNYILLFSFLIFLFSCEKEDEYNVKADFTYSPETVYVGDTIYFDASKSHNSSGTSEGLTYSWDFDNDGTLEVEPTSDPLAQYVFTKSKKYTVKLQLDYSGGGFSLKEKEINVIERTPFLNFSYNGNDFIADEFSVQYSDSKTTFRGTNTSDSSYLEIIHLNKYSTGTFSVMNGEFFTGTEVWPINDGLIKFTKFDSITNEIEGTFELELDAVSGPTVYASDGEFYLISE